MIIAIPKEILLGENRVAANPASVKELIQAGLSVQIESGAGKGSHISDQNYEYTGATIVENKAELLQNADIVLKVNHPIENEADMLKDGSVFVSLFQTTKETEAVQKLLSKKITGFSMPAGRFETLGGLLLTLFQRVPETGDRIIFRGWKLEVIEMDGPRIVRVQIDTPTRNRSSK